MTDYDDLRAKALAATPGRAPNYRLWANRLESWRDELRTNKHGFAYLAPRAIAHIERDIAYYWPDAAIDRARGRTT